jgi:hypothetical protein
LRVHIGLRDFCARHPMSRSHCRTDLLLHCRAEVLRRPLPGIGLSPPSYCLLLATSIGLFIFWGGPFWLAGSGTSHFGRIAVSYLLVAPLAAALLAWARQLTWTHFLSSCGSAWAIKMVATVVLYEAFAPGASALQPRKVLDSSQGTIRERYQPAQAPFPNATLRGTVMRGREAIANAVVFIESPRAGLASTPQRVELRIEGSMYGEPIYAARRSDPLVFVNHDTTLHTVRFSLDGRAYSSQPLPGSPAPRVVAAPPPGVYRLSCANHRSELAWLLVVDHPYVVRTDERGGFALEAVALGDVSVNAIAVAEDGLLRGSARTALGPTPSEIVIQVSIPAAESATLERRR